MMDKNFEQNDWENIKTKELRKYKIVMRGLFFNVFMYVLIFIIEYILSVISGSEVLRADAFNNLMGTISTGLLIMGVHIATDNDDGDNDLMGAPIDKQASFYNKKKYQLLRFRFETIFTLIASILMIAIALSVIFNGTHSLLNLKNQTIPKPIGMLGAAISAFIILIIYLVNLIKGKQTNNSTLLASAKDSLGDEIASVGTFISIFLMCKFHLIWMDALSSIIVGIFILYSGVQIFTESSLNLIGYFNPKKERDYCDVITENKEVKSIVGLSAHYNGGLITIDCTLMVDGMMTIQDSYNLSKKIENQLKNKFKIADLKISFIPFL